MFLQPDDIHLPSSLSNSSFSLSYIHLSLPLSLRWLCPSPSTPLSPAAFFQVLLGEVNTGLNTTQVVVKELKASASVQDQMHFLEEAQPYRYSLLKSFLESGFPARIELKCRQFIGRNV